MGRISVLAAVVLLSAVVGEVVERSRLQQDCKAQRLCDKCIQTTGCVWCINPLVVKGQKVVENCQHATTINTATFCNSSDIQDPRNHLELVKNEELTGDRQKSKKDGEQQPDIIQLKPQRVKLSLRKGMPQYLNITYQRALGYPVDLYYLMDLSNSMADDKKHLANVSTLLADTMKNLTSEFTLGFGSFVDKVMMPFSNTTRLNQQAPCLGCAIPYSFRNDMKLSQDHATFKTKVKNAKISGNLDHPEGGFDALMQAMVCTEKIGWRENARHILVFSTDAKFHHAGDGRLAGVVMPNDETCHLNDEKEEEYTAFDQYDYPSIAQINNVAVDKNINIIFAVLNFEDLYKALHKQIKTSTFGMLEKGSSNVVDLIRQQYNSISSSVTLTDNSTSDIAIKYRSSCKGDKQLETTNCDNINENDEVTFQLEITAMTCPANGERSIVQVKALEDNVILDIEFLCSCDCPPSPDKLACKNGGFLECGVCKCLEGYNGDMCQCGSDSSDPSEDQDQNARCMASEKDASLCSGRGECKCGTCRCFTEEITGTYCECNKRKCMGSTNGMECSGNGDCNCNACKCKDGYSGIYCQCEDRACIPSGSDKVCSGHGKCECDRCNCGQQGNVTYTGRFCEDCLSCGTGKCNKFKDCVQCVHFGIGPLKDDCNTCEHSKSVESLDEHMYENSRLCTFEDEEGCYLNFTYRYLEDSSKDEVFVQAQRQCPEAPPILSIVFSLIGAIVGIGVITLILWKVFTTIHDRREYAKFVRETEGVKFPAEENPLWIDPNTTTANPLFEGQQTK